MIVSGAQDWDQRAPPWFESHGFQVVLRKPNCCGSPDIVIQLTTRPHEAAIDELSSAVPW
eukprot:4606431-Amphidinium_carterae.2